MSDPRCNGYPSYLYHPTKAPNGKVFNNDEEVKALGPKWVDSPEKFPKQSKASAWLLVVFKPWWAQWEWLVKAIAVILGAIAASIILAAKFLV